MLINKLKITADCVLEKNYCFLDRGGNKLLNSESELISKCRHVNNTVPLGHLSLE